MKLSRKWLNEFVDLPLKDFSDRKHCTGTEITGLAAGSYYVRVKETGTQKAGKYASVNVPAYAAPTYAVTVKNGTGSGSYAAGVSVTIKANTPSDGKRFRKWTGADGLTFTSGSASSAAASFRMPAKAVTITATYEDAAKEGAKPGNHLRIPPVSQTKPGNRLRIPPVPQTKQRDRLRILPVPRTKPGNRRRIPPGLQRKTREPQRFCWMQGLRLPGAKRIKSSLKSVRCLAQQAMRSTQHTLART